MIFFAMITVWLRHQERSWSHRSGPSGRLASDSSDVKAGGPIRGSPYRPSPCVRRRGVSTDGGRLSGPGLQYVDPATHETAVSEEAGHLSRVH